MYISENLSEKIFFMIFGLLYTAYIITFLGIINIDIDVISQIRNIIAGIACILLLIRFNPIVKHIVTSFEKTLIFTVAGFLLFNIIISELMKYDSQNSVVNYLGKFKS
jgi:hypothetical protein